MKEDKITRPEEDMIEYFLEGVANGDLLKQYVLGHMREDALMSRLEFLKSKAEELRDSFIWDEDMDRGKEDEENERIYGC